MSQHQNSPQQEGVIQSHKTYDSTWMHIRLIVLTYSLYAKVYDLQGNGNASFSFGVHLEPYVEMYREFIILHIIIQQI
jgi:hypothetical protein